MVQLPQWLNFADHLGDVADLENNIAPLILTAERWKDIARGLTTLGKQAPLDNPAKVIAYVLDHLDDADVSALLTELDLGDVAADLAEIKAKIAKSQYSKLLQPVADTAEVYSLPGEGRVYDPGTDKGLVALKVAAGGQRTVSAGKVAFALSGNLEAGLEVEAGAVWPFRGDGVAPGLLRIGGQATLVAKGGASAPFSSIGTVGARASVSFAPRFDYFFRPGADSLFVSALVPSLRAMPDPFDLQAINNAAAISQFEGLVLAITGAAEAGLELGLGKDLEVPEFITGRAQLAAALSFARQSDWLLSLRKNGTGFDFVLSRALSSRRSWSVGLNIKLDASGLARHVNAALKEVTKLTDKWLSQIEPFLSPGTYVQRHLGKLLEKAAGDLSLDTGLVEAIQADASIVLGGETSGGLAIETWLIDQITGAIDDVEEGIYTDATAFLGKIFGRLEAQIPAFARSALSVSAKTSVESLIGKLKEEFDGVVAEALADKSRSKAVVRELEAVGIEIKSAANAADAAAAGLRELVTQYRAFVAKIVACTEEGETAKIAASLAFSGEDQTREQYELVGRMERLPDGSVSAGACALWRSLMSGKLQPFQRVLHDAALAPAGVTLSDTSFLSRFASSKRGFSASVAIFDMQFEFNAVAFGEAEVREYGGRIVVSAKAEAKRRMAFLDVSREANFISVYDLAATKRGAATSRTMTVVLDLTRRDEDLSAKELKNFLAGLVDTGLISRTRQERALELLDDASRGASGKLAGDVTVRFNLSERGLEALLALGRGQARDAQVRRAMIIMAVNVLADAGFERSLLNYAFDVLRAKSGYADAAAALADGQEWRLSRPGPRETVGSRMSELHRVLLDLKELAKDLATMFGAIAEVYDAIPMDVGTADHNFYRDAELKLAKSAKNWIRLKQLFKTRMNPAMLGLLHILAALEGPRATMPLSVATADLTGLLAAVAAPLPAGLGDDLIKITMKLGLQAGANV